MFVYQKAISGKQMLGSQLAKGNDIIFVVIQFLIMNSQNGVRIGLIRKQQKTYQQ